MFMRVDHKGCLAGAILCALLYHASGGEAPPDETPPPELQKLGTAVGLWKTTTQSRFSPDGTVVESTSIENVRWSDSRQFLVTEQRGSTPDGWISRICITSWNAADRQIHVIEVSPGGSITDSTLWFEGSIEKVLGYRRLQGRLFRTELTVEHTSPDEFTFHYDCLDQEKSWVCCEGKSRRSK
jgi:Protein of unknown function (DUF1579)